MQQPMPNPEDITDPTTAMNMALVLMAKAFKLNYSTPTNNNQRISSNPRNRQIAQPGMNIGQNRQMHIGGNGGNQFRQYAGQNVGNQNGYNAVQNVGNQVVQNAVQNLGVQNVGNQNGLIVVPGIANQNPNGNGNVVAAQAGGNAIANNGNQIRFTSPPRRSFVGGLVATVDPVELETFTTNQVKRILTYSLGYDENSPTFLYLRKPNCSLDSGLVPLADALQDRNMLLTYAQSHQNRLHVYVSRVEISPLVVADQHKDEGKKKEKHGKPSCSKKLFE
ncbi:hypothetical protein Tco_1426488 [Tanacetum coccineum]